MTDIPSYSPKGERVYCFVVYYFSSHSSFWATIKWFSDYGSTRQCSVFTAWCLITREQNQWTEGEPFVDQSIYGKCQVRTLLVWNILTSLSTNYLSENSRVTCSWLPPPPPSSYHHHHHHHQHHQLWSSSSWSWWWAPVSSYPWGCWEGVWSQKRPSSRWYQWFFGTTLFILAYFSCRLLVKCRSMNISNPWNYFFLLNLMI